jgi:peptidoglycan/LPS O-acetylase OafA/YrhL
MSNQSPAPDNTYGRLTGWKRLAIVVLGAISGAVVALMFSVFSGHPTPTWELIIGAIGGALLGLSASLGEARRKNPVPDRPPAPPRGE